MPESRLGQSGVSPLAWELARHAKSYRVPGGVKAWIYVANGTCVFGVGPAPGEARRELAHNLDKWARSDYAGI